MPEQFNPQKILEIAAEVKENSAKLFEALERKTLSAELRNLWGYLKEDSQIHCKVFKEMCADPESYIVYEITSGEYNLYLKEVIPSFHYAQEAIVKKTKGSFERDLEAVEFAIYVVIESTLAYATLKDYILPLKLDLFNKIVGDEKKHLAKLNLAKRKLMG